MIQTRRISRVTGTAHLQERRAHCSLCSNSGDLAPVPGEGLPFYNLMIRTCCFLGDHLRADAWLAEVAASGIAPDVQTFLPFLNFYAGRGDVDKINMYFASMVAVGVPANSCTQHALMRAYSVKEDLVGVQMGMADMQKRGFPTSEFSYDLLIHTCAKLGLLEQAETYVAEMEREGTDPTLTTYNCLINVCTKCDDMERAWMWFAHMVRKGIAPNVVTYGTLCKGIACHGDAETVVELMQRCKADGLALNEYLYVSLLIACERSGQRYEQHVQRAFLDMVQRGIPTANMLHRFVRILGRERMDLLQRTAGRLIPTADQGAYEACTIVGALSL